MTKFRVTLNQEFEPELPDPEPVLYGIDPVQWYLCRCWDHNTSASRSVRLAEILDDGVAWI